MVGGSRLTGPNRRSLEDERRFAGPLRGLGLFAAVHGSEIWPESEATQAAGGVRCLGSTCRRSVGPHPPLLTQSCRQRCRPHSPLMFAALYPMLIVSRAVLPRRARNQ
jgi:hypothetical protein